MTKKKIGFKYYPLNLNYEYLLINFYQIVSNALLWGLFFVKFTWNKEEISSSKLYISLYIMILIPKLIHIFSNKYFVCQTLYSQNFHVNLLFDLFFGYRVLSIWINSMKKEILFSIHFDVSYMFLYA
jgi:hypothetical protein